MIVSLARKLGHLRSHNQHVASVRDLFGKLSCIRSLHPFCYIRWHVFQPFHLFTLHRISPLNPKRSSDPHLFQGYLTLNLPTFGSVYLSDLSPRC